VWPACRSDGVRFLRPDGGGVLAEGATDGTRRRTAMKLWRWTLSPMSNSVRSFGREEFNLNQTY
jgi:hypothetical protein